MLQNIIAMGTLIGFFSILFITPYMYAKGIYLLEYETLNKKDKLLCYVPILNIIKAEHLYTGKISITGISVGAIIFSTLARLFVVFQFPGNLILNIVSVVLFVLSLLFFYISSAINVYRIINDAGTMQILATILFSVIFPIGQYYIGNFLPTIAKNFGKEEEVFK